ncbi:bifunctional folylpolyglutamate synthase/dihydrofolate synthase [Opitutus terrae]|uniref:Dihydrofolate synthase/folylpolyglutamate synthase n=1 Tax=Opitutus terrae (strain DSM 11246 / JCM 15787 / PB90-1) TaxID=452637 RepID=B1ZVD5_OPITP|nr:folylpolyglutamate synthase/dihydrofolate synthase family protein [Opitutus terrae]ACB76802.1 FolC bifunctional protein [Opitutus terrae PB90-1]
MPPSPNPESGRGAQPDAAAGFEAVAEYLCGLKAGGSKLGLDRMRLLAAELGHPERALRCVHVAGTNGKGSVAAMLEAILRAAGWRVGLFTSPHLVHVGERVQVNRQPLAPAEIVGYVRELDVLADRIAAREGPGDRPSFFEYMTAMALLQFGRQRCDIAVMEVGLGGEFDATNLVDPEMTVITSIGFDHCEWLGHTLEEIARAKAGIIKPERPVVIGRVPPAAETVIRARAEEMEARVISVREVYGENLAVYPETNLAGDYQRWNAATATLAARELDSRWRISERAIAHGLWHVRWPGRWQRVLVGGRRVILDASHNAEGASVLDANLARLRAETGRAPIVVVGVLGAERAQPLMAAICRHAGEVHLVVPNQPRASSYEELAALIPAGFPGRVARTTVAEIFPGGDHCALGGPDDSIVITGSIYLLGEVLPRIGAGTDAG